MGLQVTLMMVLSIPLVEQQTELQVLVVRMFNMILLLTQVYPQHFITMKEQLELLLTQITEDPTELSIHQVHIVMTLYSYTMLLGHGKTALTHLPTME